MIVKTSEPTQSNDRQRALNEAWRAVDACGGTGMHPEYAKALDDAIAAIERLGGRDPDLTPADADHDAAHRAAFERVDG